jgi:hypothetical protein
LGKYLGTRENNPLHLVFTRHLPLIGKEQSAAFFSPDRGRCPLRRTKGVEKLKKIKLKKYFIEIPVASA